MAKTNYNKHVANPSEVTTSVFSNEEELKYGEIVLCNSIDEPGIYIFTRNDGGETKIKKVNSVENIMLDANVDPSVSGVVVSGDSLTTAVSKLQNQINEIVVSGDTGTTKVNNVVAGVGLNPDGTYSAITGDYVATATSIADAIKLLDAAITTVSGATLQEAKAYTDSKVAEAIQALDAEETAGDGEVFVKIIENDGIVSGEVQPLSVVKDVSGLKYDLKLGNFIFGSIDIPQDQFLEGVTFISAATIQDVADALNHGQRIEEGKPYLKFVWKLEGGVVSPTYVDVSGLIDVYTAADVKLSNSYTGTSFDIKSGDTIEDAIGKITNEMTSIEESITANEIASSGKTILVASSATGTNIDVNIDGDTIVADETVAGQGKLSVKLDVEKQHIDTGYVRTQYTLKSSGSTYGVINDTRDVFVGDNDGFISVTTEQVSDAEGNRTDKITIEPVIQKVINNATSESAQDGNGLVTAWAVKTYVKDGLDGDGVMVGDDNLLQYHPYEYWRGKINFDSQTLGYDTVHEAFYKTDNNMELLDRTIGLAYDGQQVHLYPSAETQNCLLISGDTTIMSALKTLDKGIDDMDYTADTEENKVFTGITQTNGHVAVTSENLTNRKLAGYAEVNVPNPSGATYKVAATDKLGQALGKLQGQINAMDWTGSTTSDEVFTGMTEKDGLVSATTALITSKTLKGYAVQTITDTSAAASKVATGDTLGVGLGKLQGQINAMDYTANTGTDKVFTYVANKDGQLTTSAENITSRVITGYAEATDADIAATDTLGVALGKLQKQINSMDYTANTGTDKVFTYIAEADGKVTTSADNITNRIITGYAVGSDAKIAATDSLGGALGKIQGQINAMDKATQAEANSVIYDVTETDGKVSATSKHIVDIKLSGYTVGADTSAKITSGDTLGTALGKLQGQVNGLDWTGTTTANEVFTGITETDGKVSATTALITSRTLSGYSATANTKVAASQTLGVALGNLQGQIDSLDYSADAGTDKVITAITQTDGKVAVSAQNITSRIITGYAVGSDAKIAATDSLGGALGKIQGQINAMDKATQAEANSVIYDVTETDGKVSATSKHIVDIKLSGYTEGTDADITSGDTLGTALGKLQKQINSMDKAASAATGKFVRTVSEADGKVSETLGYILDSDVKITAATVNDANVKEAWKLVNQEGTQLGSTIKIYKDSSLKSVTLSGDTSTTGQWLIFTYILADGSESKVAVDVSKFLVQAEFKSGVTADNSGIVHGVVDSNSEKNESNVAFLTVGADGFKVSGIKDAIDTKINKLDSSTADVSAGYVLTKVAIADGKISGRTQTDSIHSATTASHAVAAGKVDSALTVSYGSTASTNVTFDGSANKTIYIPNNTNQLTNGANFITTAATVSKANSATTAGHADAATQTDKKLTVSYGSTASTNVEFNGSADKTIYIPNNTNQLTNGANFITTAATVANANKVANKDVGNASGNVPLSDGNKNTNLNADMVDGYHIVVGSTGTTANTIYIL